jgi:hypothetical protein
MTTTTQTTPTATLLRRAIDQVRETNKALWQAECQRLKDSGYEDWVDEVRAEDERLELAAAESLDVEHIEPLEAPVYNWLADEEVDEDQDYGHHCGCGDRGCAMCEQY